MNLQNFSSKRESKDDSLGPRGDDVTAFSTLIFDVLGKDND